MVAVYEGTLGYIQETHASILTVKEHANRARWLLYVVVRYWTRGEETVVITLLETHKEKCTARSNLSVALR